MFNCSNKWRISQTDWAHSRKRNSSWCNFFRFSSPREYISPRMNISWYFQRSISNVNHFSILFIQFSNSKYRRWSWKFEEHLNTFFRSDGYKTFRAALNFSLSKYGLVLKAILKFICFCTIRYHNIDSNTVFSKSIKFSQAIIF